ncbi:hypothetical protein KKC1_12590, partial [Calderihabitans maritimus]
MEWTNEIQELRRELRVEFRNIYKKMEEFQLILNQLMVALKEVHGDVKENRQAIEGNR